MTESRYRMFQEEEGHKILKLEDNEDGTYTLYVRKVED